MSYRADIVCRTCKVKFPLGKLRWDMASPRGLESGVGFWSPGITDEELGRSVIEFLAKHVTHDVVVAGDGAMDGLIGDIGEYDILEVMDDDCPWAKTHEPIYLGGVKFYLRYCESVADREARRAEGDK